MAEGVSHLRYYDEWRGKGNKFYNARGPNLNFVLPPIYHST